MKRIVTYLIIGIYFAGCVNSERPAEPKMNKEVSGANDTTVIAGREETLNRKSNYEDMIYFQGGEIQLGANTGVQFQGPAFKTFVQPFYLDVHPVTVAMFSKFVEETGYRTEADKFGNAGVFDLALGNWKLVERANWLYPFGPSAAKATDDHPVTQVSWFDAMAYCQWAGKRLPTEIEWEYAARNGKSGENKYSWGNEIRPGGKYLANYWQGEVTSTQGTDGFIYTSPVGYYGIMPNGLTDMSGNVWEWCESTFSPYEGNREYYLPDPNAKVIRGGSFFYDEAGDESLTVYFRAYNTVETSLFNLGFRCAADPSD